MGFPAEMKYRLSQQGLFSLTGRTCLGALLLTAISVHAIVAAQLSDGPLEVRHIHGLTVDRREPDILYMATHTGLVRLRPNAPPEWVGSHRMDLMGFTAHPQEASLVYASGHPDALSYQRFQAGNLGLLMSRDGGETWHSVALMGEADFHALTYTARNGGELYGWSVAGHTGLHRISTTTWRVERLAAQELSDVWSLATSPDGTGPLFAGTKKGLWVSRDWGVTWSRVAAISDAPVTAISYHSGRSGLVYIYVAREDHGLMRSRDGGRTWEAAGYIGDMRTPVVALAVGPGERVALATTNSTVLRSQDGGRTWQTVLDRGRWVAPVR